MTRGGNSVKTSVLLEWEKGRSVACDSRFLYVTGTKGSGLVKLGTGLHGTVRYRVVSSVSGR